MAFDLQHCRENFRQRVAAQQAACEALRQQARKDAIAAIRQIVPRYPQVSQIYLFGSITHPGQFRESSDIDIAVAGTDAATYFDLWRDLDAACPNWAIDLREIGPPSHFTHTVRQFGELICEPTSSTAQSKH